MSVAEVDYTSVDSLVKALRGLDAVVSAVNNKAIGSQKVAIDASIQAGVRRYIPADWGALTTDPEAQKLPVHALSVDIQNYLKEKAQSGQLEYTIFATGPFLDLLISFPFAFDYANQKAELYDDGKHPFSTTTTANIGQAVAGALKNPESTKNRVIRIHDIVVTQAKLVALAKKYSPPGAKWTETSLDGDAELQKILDSIKTEGLDAPKAMALTKAALLSGKYAAEYKPVDNELVGLGFMTEEDLDALFAEKYKSNGASEVQE